MHIDGNPDLADGLTFTGSDGEQIRPVVPVVPAESLPPPTATFEPATLQRMTLGEFYGWSERGARTTREYRQRLRRQHESDDDPDDA